MQRFYVFVFLLLVAIGCFANPPRVLVYTLDSEIDGAAWRHTSRALHQADVDNMDMFIMRLNTYGGSVDMADSIRTALLNCPIPTVVYIDHNAASAGALISLACDSIYMAPGATIGAASVVNGNGELMPVKYQSYWSSIMRATAMSHGKYIPEGDSIERWRRDPEIAADMVNTDKALSLTAREAVDCGIADGIAADLQAVLKDLGIDNANIDYFSLSASDSFLGFLASAAVRAILITLILGGIYMEMHTPGLGFPSAVALVAAVLYFLPSVVTGTVAAWVVPVFVIGVVLLALEIFVIPGFGIAGIGGILCILASLVGAMLAPGFTFSDGLQPLVRACVILLIGIVLAVAGALWLTSRFGPSRFRRVAALTHTQDAADGYVGVDTSLASLVGRSGTAVSDMRPSGKVLIDGNIYDAISTGAFIPSGSTITVVRYMTAQLYVTVKTD